MLNALVLVCVDCGNVELEVKCIDDGTKTINFYCPKCGNVGHMQGFTAGPMMLGTEKVREIKEKAVKPTWGNLTKRSELDPTSVRAKKKGMLVLSPYLIKEA